MLGSAFLAFPFLWPVIWAKSAQVCYLVADNCPDIVYGKSYPFHLEWELFFPTRKSAIQQPDPVLLGYL